MARSAPHFPNGHSAVPKCDGLPSSVVIKITLSFQIFLAQLNCFYGAYASINLNCTSVFGLHVYLAPRVCSASAGSLEQSLVIGCLCALPPLS